jgi:hypothetical protein
MSEVILVRPISKNGIRTAAVQQIRVAKVLIAIL